MSMLERLFSVYEDLFECYVMHEDMKHHKASPYRGFRIIGPQKQIIYARSLWEANVAHYLEWLKQQGIIKFWMHEPQTFYFDWIKRGCNNYTPDFKVIDTDGNESWIEVKGHMDAKSLTKIKRFKKMFPDDLIRIYDSKWFRANQAKLKLIVPGWETEKNTSIISTEEIKKMRESHL